jgi:hypothetical protein
MNKGCPKSDTLLCSAEQVFCQIRPFYSFFIFWPHIGKGRGHGAWSKGRFEQKLPKTLFITQVCTLRV